MIRFGSALVIGALIGPGFLLALVGMAAGTALSVTALRETYAPIQAVQRRSRK